MEYTNTIWPEWKIVGKIGQGTYGTVYKIEKHDMLGTEQAALKIISLPRSEDDLYMLRHSGMDEQTVSRTLEKQVTNILQEYKLMRALRDVPGVVHCDNYGYVAHPDGLGWDIHIQMELLTPFLRQKELIREEADIVRFGIELCRTLESCHAHGIIHRDIKPHNVFVTDDGRYKLGDFGIARFSDGTATATMGAGTLSFMAPEVLAGKRYNHTVDLYSLGMVMYWLLNDSKGPFLLSGCTQEEASTKRFGGEPLPAPKNGSAGLKQIVLKACAFDPKARFASAAQMRAALETLKPVRSSPLSVPARTIPSENTDKTLGIFSSARPRPQEPADAPIPEVKTEPVSAPEPEYVPPVRRRRTLSPQKRKKELLLRVAAAILALFAAFWLFVHVWNEPTCTKPKSCKICFRFFGEPLGHDWIEANCVRARTCTRCGETEGEALGHDWLDATKDAPKTCTRCAATEGEPISATILGYYFSNLYTSRVSDHSYDRGTNSVCITFTEARYLNEAMDSLSVTDSNGDVLDPSLYRIELEDKNLRIYLLEGVAAGIYHIDTNAIDKSLIYGWHGELYWVSTTLSLFECSAQNYKNGRHLTVVENDESPLLTTKEDADAATVFYSMRYACDITEQDEGPAISTDSGYTSSDGTWHAYSSANRFESDLYYMRDTNDEYVELRTLIYEGFYLASDAEGNVYITQELTDECYWLVTMH